MIRAAQLVIPGCPAPTPRRAPHRDIEGPIHRTVLRYLRLTLPHGFIVQHTPNGGMLKGENGRSKALGAVAGWPDLAIYGQLDDQPKAWFMEIKPPRGVVSDDQRDVHARLMDAGFPVRIVRSLEDAKRAVWDWNLPSLDASLNRKVA